MYSREKQLRQENHKAKKSSHRNTPSFSSSLLDEICRSIDDKPPEAARFSRPSLVEKWMDNDKSVFRRRPKCENAVFPDNTSTSTTSSDSSPVDPTASDTELLANRPKPVRTRQSDSYLFDEYEEHERNRAPGNDDLIKSKSRALRLYSNLKKMKQPISPGARLTSFINSIFSGLNRKKSKEFKESDRIGRKAATPSPAKTTTRKSTDMIEQTPRFDLAASAVVDRDDTVMRRGHTSMGGGGGGGSGRPPLPPNAFQNRRKCHLRYEEEEEEDEDACSESSSDLFELDHLSLFGSKDRFIEELPVYETTYFDKNCRLIR